MMPSDNKEAAQPWDALLILSFGGPEKREDVMPFLENVLRGRNVPRERLLEVAEHYYHFGGRSPINDQNRALIAALEAELGEHGPALPIYWGNRNWRPFLADTLRDMAAAGCRARAGLCDVGIQLVFGMPAISGRHRAGARRGRGGCAGGFAAAAFLQSSAVHRNRGQPGEGSARANPG